ncbi:MAG: macrolide ABC transporter ATP-binding protein [Thermoproteota archaeon]|nr:MAG: macrolide ABC transporter ATP-binding protein [Candidatus Korarchaeota archaeon]
MLVVTEDLVKVYKLGKVEIPALRGVSLDIEEGEFLGIFGPSGSGKSTLLHLIGVLDLPTSGRVIIEGVDVSKLNEDKRAELRAKKIGFVFQFFNLIPRLNALENVALPMAFMGVPRSERRERALKLLDLVDLRDRWNHKPNELSGGEEQRVAIARALANDPSIILADEPTGNLDSKTGKEIVNLFKRLNEEEGKTIVIVTHDQTIAEVCRRIIYLRDGVIYKEVVK